ncbi:hypothetical protein K435DRAFT_870565 [Dendrothele bispora CBS 962.96]|uniref:Myb/SANT-like domain-containing protein n=1 Tax=Dendrothele bispora (strain CBS 962.96) TaxID=1314807 RepID=A0A4S8L6Y9_DENBC|nr:hypothetical protein K435DRAFT_870565 [Dendrothele bispora CBS 962.96]
MTQSKDKENQPIEASTTDDAAPLQKKCGRPKGSKNKPKDGSKTKTPDTATTVPETVEKPKAPRPRAIYSDADDKKLMEVFLEHKQEGNGTDNGGWKSKAITAAVAALAGSELESGGAPKSATSIRDHWDHVDPRLASYRGKSFPIYDDMKELLEGALATGANAFRAGKDNSDSDTSSESGNEADANPDTSFENVVTPAKVLKRKVSALGETPATKKRSRDPIENVAVAMTSGNGTSEKETKKLACQLVRDSEGFLKGEMARLLLHISKDIDFADLLINTDDVELRVEIMQIQLQS